MFIMWALANLPSQQQVACCQAKMTIANLLLTALRRSAMSLGTNTAIYDTGCQAPELEGFLAS